MGETLALRPLDYALPSAAVTHGNLARILLGGAEAFPAMLEAIGRAEREVFLESYIIADDDTGRAFLDALVAAAARGLSVHLLCDGVGSFSLPDSWFDRLRAAGASTLVYRPPIPWLPRWGVWRRDHRKILVVDGRIGFVGGINIADEYDQRTVKGHSWRDLHLRLEGPAAIDLAYLFVRTWNREVAATAERLVWHRPDVAPHPAGVAVSIVGNREMSHRWLIRRTFLRAAQRARRSLLMANPYFIPDRKILRALLRAARAGLDVRVVLPARSDIRLVDLASRATFPRLLDAGVRIAEWPGMIHAKVAAVDGAWATVGSYNFDHRSLLFNLEVTANVFDGAVAEALEERLRDDFATATEINRELFARRPLHQRILSTLAYELRALL